MIILNQVGMEISNLDFALEKLGEQGECLEIDIPDFNEFESIHVSVPRVVEYISGAVDTARRGFPDIRSDNCVFLLSYNFSVENSILIARIDALLMFERIWIAKWNWQGSAPFILELVPSEELVVGGEK